jgi:hypothetical protein
VGELPMGTVTFLFTDVVGSSRSWAATRTFRGITITAARNHHQRCSGNGARRKRELPRT